MTSMFYQAPTSAAAASGETGVTNIVVVGSTGVGKSSLLNHVIGLVDPSSHKPFNPSKHFRTSAKMNEGCTVKTQACTGKANTFGEKTRTTIPTLRLVDCPGLGDPDGDAQDRLNIANMVKFIKPLKEVHQFILVMNSEDPRLSAADQNTIAVFLKMFPSEEKTNPTGEFFRNMIVVFTHWGMSKPESDRRRRQSITKEFVIKELQATFYDRFQYSGVIRCEFVDNWYEPKNDVEVKAMRNAICNIWALANTNDKPFKTAYVKKADTLLEGLDKQLEEIKTYNAKLQEQQKVERAKHERTMQRLENQMAEQGRSHETQRKALEDEISNLRSRSASASDQSALLKLMSVFTSYLFMQMGGGGMGGGDDGGYTVDVDEGGSGWCGGGNVGGGFEVTEY